ISITELVSALCDRCLSGVSWKRRALGGISREGFHKTLKKRAYGALLSKVFQDGTTKGCTPRPNPTASNTPPRNKVLMICFDLRVAGCREEAERLEDLLDSLPGGASSGLKEVDAVLELLVHLAGTTPPPPTTFSLDYMRGERPVERKPQPCGYQSEELQRLEARAWGLICAEEWGALDTICGTLRLMDAPPGTGLETRMTLFGALQHTRTSDIDIRLDLPPIPSNIDVTGLAIKVPPCLDQSEDEGFQSASNLTPDSQSESSPGPELDVWEALRTFEPGRRRCWESVGCTPGNRESLFVTESGREAFDQLYPETHLHLCSLCPRTPRHNSSPMSSTCSSECVQFDVRPSVCVSGASPESVSRLLQELAQYGTHYLRLSHFSLQSAHKKGLVFQAFTGGLRKYLHYYRACVLSTPPSLSLLTIGFLFRKVGHQLRYLSELCCVDGPLGAGQATFPVGVKLLSYLYNEAQNNCSNENYPVLLSLLKRSCGPYTRFVSDWVYSGVFRDVYGEFMIQVNEEYLGFRDKNFWVQGYTLISKDVEDCVPIFLRHIANDVYVCGKTINLLKICCPQHYICWSELPVPRIAVTFSLREVEEIEKDCAVYRGRMERIAKHSAVSREEQVIKRTRRQVSQRLAEEAKKRERFEELKLHLEQEQEVGSRQEEDDFSFARELRDRENRLQALEDQLEQQARKELIAQYSRLSAEAALRERRALWRVQRMRLDEARCQFLTQDKQRSALFQESPPEVFLIKQSEETLKSDPVPQTETSSPPATSTPPIEPNLISEDIDVNDFLPKPPNPDSTEVDFALQDIGSDLTQTCPTVLLVDYDFSAPFSPLEGMSVQSPRPNTGPGTEPERAKSHPSFSHFPIGEDVPLAQEALLKASPFEQATKSSFTLGQLVAEESQVIPENDLLLSPSSFGHSSDSHIRVGQNVSDYTAPLHSPNIHGHASDSNLKLGDFASEVAPSLPSQNVHGHSSDSRIKVGENVSDFVSPLPTHNVHGHASDAHVKLGELFSDVDAALPLPSVYGHASDSRIKVGENVSDFVSTLPAANVHGHSSDANLEVGEFVSNVTQARPRWSKHGHASDSALQSGCTMSGSEPVLSPLPGSDFGHSSDSILGTGCLVTGQEPVLSPLPGSAYGHSSDSNLGTGCVVSKHEMMLSPLPGSTFGHSSDSALGTGCLVTGQEPMLSPLPGSAYGHSSDSNLGIGCVVSKQETMLSPLPGTSSPECQLLKHVTRGPWALDSGLQQAPDSSSVQLSEMVSLPVLIKHSVTAPLITHVSLVNKAVVDYFFVELGVERHFEALRHFLLMEDGEFAQSLSDRLFEKLGSGQTPGELLTPLVLNSILNKALQYSLHGDSPLAPNFTFALRYLPETFHPHAPDSLNCLDLRYKVDWPLNIIITDSCMSKYNRLFSFLLQLKHMVWSLRDVWFHLKRTALVKGAGRSVQFRQLQLYRHEMQHFVKVIQGYIANQILQVSWSEFITKLSSATDLDAIHRTHADYLNRAIFRGLLTDKAAPVMNIIHSIFSLILKFRAQLIAQPWDSQQGEAVHPSFIAMQQSYNTFKYYSHFLFKVVTKLVNRGYQPHLEDFLLRINFNNYYKDS
uniref:Gamma-tubulin complex component 6 n=1 Tax=Neogobius melanostomus TaxID=47308 RepID=A0A8C6TSU2_9GOBI